MTPTAALTDFSLLPSLLEGVVAGQGSSVDPAGKNNDGSPSNILYKTASGASVIFSATGPGVVDDIWVAGSLTAMGNIVITLDGAHTPQVDMPAAQFFSGTASPFLTPLVGDATVSSGGDYANVPIAFRRSCVIAFTGVTAYWHVGFRRFPAGTSVQTFSPMEDLSSVVAAWSRAGHDPWPSGGAVTAGGPVSLAPHASVTLANLQGPAEIDALRLMVPAATVEPSPVLTATGVEFTGTAQFTLRVNPEDTGTVLVCRLDAAVPNQSAMVAVDGVPVGAFSMPATVNGPDLWRDASVSIPATVTAGRGSLTVTLTAQQPFTTFGCWLQAQASGRTVTTDTLSLTSASEAAHGFVASTLLWQRQLTSQYLPPELSQSAAVLSALRLRITFDGSATPQVDAPAGLFFLAGDGAGSVRSLMGAVHPTTGALAAYWPMPFAQSATVTLTNTGATTVAGLTYAVDARPDPQAATALASGAIGYFHANYREANPTPASGQYTILNAPGTGKLVGVSMAMATPPGMPYGLKNLQGNVNITLDGDPQPAYVGTGTEDFFEGGWYFQDGPFSLPTHGSPADWVATDGAAEISAYRLLIGDAVPFNRGAVVTAQVGPTSNLTADYASVAFWYGRPVSTLVPVDSFALDSAVEASAHHLTLTPAPASATATSGVPTVADPAAKAMRVASFTLSVPSRNGGIELRAQLDGCPGHLAAEVQVNGRDVGTWRYPGADCVVPAVMARFLVPASVSRGANTLHVRLTAVPAPGAAAGAVPVWSMASVTALAWEPSGAGLP
jgi:hypothetical protein